MSLHSDIVTSGLLAAELVTAGAVTLAAQVYTGRRPQKITRTDGEVWVEKLPIEEIGTGLQGRALHPYLLHVFAGPFNSGPAGAGDAQLATVEATLETISSAFSGKSLFTANPEVISHSAAVESIDSDPEEDRVVEGTIRVEFVVTR